MLYFGGWQPGERADICPKADLPPALHMHTRPLPARDFIVRKRGLHAETAQKQHITLIVILKLAIRGLTRVAL